MKLKAIFASTFLFAFLTSQSQVIIDGQINNYDGKSKVTYSPTVEGILTAFDNVSRIIQPAPNGRFRIKYDNPGLASTRLGFDGLTYSLVHDGDSHVKLVIDQARIKFPKNRKKSDLLRDSVKRAATILIEGDYAAMNRFNNRSARTSMVAFRVGGCEYSRLIAQAETPFQALTTMDSLVQAEVDHLNLISSTIKPERSDVKTSTPELKEFMKSQIHSFYGTVFLTAMMQKRIDQIQLRLKDTDAPDSVYNQQWESLVEHFLKQASENIAPAPESFEYNEFVLSAAYTIENYKVLDINPPGITNDELVVKRLMQPPLAVLDSLGLVNEQAILAYKIHNLSRFLYTQTFYSPVLRNAVDRLRAQYPGSELFPPFEPKIALLETYLKKSASSYDKFKIIPKNYLSLTDLIEQFKGKNLFIDIWATWCAPCVEDFNFKSVLRPFIEQDRLTVLYISIDKPSWRKKWEENIKFNELDGYHVLANDVLIQDIWKQLGGPEGMIPRYALIDKDGSIYLSDAARPSQGEILVRQISSLLERE